MLLRGHYFKFYTEKPTSRILAIYSLTQRAAQVCETQQYGFVGSGEPDDFPLENHLNEFVPQIRQPQGAGAGMRNPRKKS